MIRKYTYIKINNYHFCLQQNPVILCWILFFKKKDLISICTPWLKTKPPHGIKSHLWLFFSFFMNNFKMLGIFMKNYIKFRDIDSVVKLPVYGHLCRHVHRGYKVFDLRRGTVTKIVDSDVHKDYIIDEIERLYDVSHIDFAPALGKSNVNERWFEEEYVSGSPPSSYKSPDSSTLLKSFSSEIVPLLNRLMSFKQPKSMISMDYVNKVNGIFESGNSSMAELNIKEKAAITNFLYSTVERIKKEGNSPIYLVFSHGDFCPANMLNTPKGLRVLDWESAAYRSALFDFYCYFFYRPVCINLPVEKMVPELNDALQIFMSDLALKPSDISKNILYIEHIYRWIFYIEYICKLVERERSDKNLNIMDFIFRYIDAFNHYEEMLNNNK